MVKARHDAWGEVQPLEAYVPRRMTFEEYMSLPEEKRRCELLSGWMFREPSPGDLHQSAVGNLFGLLWNHIRQTRSGRVYLGPFDIVLSRENVVQPDILFVAAGRTGIITGKNVQGPPDLAVEVISPYSARKDRILRIRLYARSGIREYWIVDPERRTVGRFTPWANRLVGRLMGRLVRALSRVTS